MPDLIYSMHPQAVLSGEKSGRRWGGGSWSWHWHQLWDVGKAWPQQHQVWAPPLLSGNVCACTAVPARAPWWREGELEHTKRGKRPASCTRTPFLGADCHCFSLISLTLIIQKINRLKINICYCRVCILSLFILQAQRWPQPPNSNIFIFHFCILNPTAQGELNKSGKRNYQHTNKTDHVCDIFTLKTEK